MIDEKDFIELDIDLENHPHFMICAERIGLFVNIKSGKYFIYYNDAKQLFELGKQFSRIVNKDFYCTYGLTK